MTLSSLMIQLGPVGFARSFQAYEETVVLRSRPHGPRSFRQAGQRQAGTSSRAAMKRSEISCRIGGPAEHQKFRIYDAVSGAGSFVPEEGGTEIAPTLLNRARSSVPTPSAACERPLLTLETARLESLASRCLMPTRERDACLSPCGKALARPSIADSILATRRNVGRRRVLQPLVVRRARCRILLSSPSLYSYILIS